MKGLLVFWAIILSFAIGGFVGSVCAEPPPPPPPISCPDVSHISTIAVTKEKEAEGWEELARDCAMLYIEQTLACGVSPYYTPFGAGEEDNP